MHVHRRVFFILVLLFLVQAFCLGQSLKFENYSTRDGLPSDGVYNLHQDKQGYIWIFTGDGPVKYNSLEFKPVLRNLPYKESFIYSVYENRQGRMWVANSNGNIYEVIRDSAFVVKGTEEISEQLRKNVSEILKLHVDDSLNIYAMTKYLSYRFTRKDSGYQAALIEVNEPVEFLVLDKHPDLLLAAGLYKHEKKLVHHFISNTHCRIGIKNNDRLDVFEIPTFQAPTIPKVFRREGKEVYFSFYNRLFRIDAAGRVTITMMPAMINNFVIDKRHHIWVASLKGLVEVNEKDSIVNCYFPETAFNDVLLDSCNGLWASMARSGLLHCRNLNTLYFGNRGWQDGQIHFMKLLDGTLFAANVRGELYSIRHDTMRCVKRTDLQIPVLLDLVKKNTSYITSYQLAVERFSLHDNKAVVTQTTLGHNTLKLIPLDDQNLLCITRNSIGLHVNGKLMKSYDIGQKIFTGEFWNNTLFISTTNGIYTLDQATFKRLRDPDDVPHIVDARLIQPSYLSVTKDAIIRRIVKGPAGDLWLCSVSEGLFRLSANGMLAHFTVAQGLPSNNIHDISFADSLVLLSTNKGLYIGKPGTKQGTLPRAWKHIYAGDAHFGLMYENKIYAVTQDGIVAIPPDVIGGKKIYFNLAAVFVDSKQAPQEALSHIAHNQILQLEFDLIDLSGRRDTISYHLSGNESESGVLYDGRFTLQHFSPGNYTLTVIPHADRSKTISLPLRIKPAFWQTSAFRITAGVSFLFLIFLLSRLLFMRFKKKELKKLEAERLISEYKLTALKAQFNPHFMSNCLVAIQNLIYSGHVDKAGEYLAKFSAFMRKILDYSDKQYQSLEEEIAVIRSYVELEQLRFKSDFNFELRLDKSIHVNEVLIPALITQPHVENAIWHGLLPLKERAPRLLVDIFTKEDILFLVIKDNGVGRKKSPEGTPGKSSKGTQLINERIVSLNHIHSNLQIRIEIADLSDDRGFAAGTQITIQLPIYTLDE